MSLKIRFLNKKSNQPTTTVWQNRGFGHESKRRFVFGNLVKSETFGILFPDFAKPQALCEMPCETLKKLHLTK